MAAAAGDEEQGEDVFTEEVTGVKDCVLSGKVKDCVFRSVFSARNAEYQVRALTIGTEIATLSPGEAKLAGQISSKTTGLMRSWE